MGRGVFLYEVKVRAPIEEVWTFFSTASNLAKITTFPKVTIKSDPTTKAGNTIEMKLNFLIMKLTWKADILDVKEFEYFIDRAVVAPFPFKSWHHTHSFQKVDDNHTLIIDRVEYESFFPNFLVHTMLKQMFSSRGKQINKKLSRIIVG